MSQAPESLRALLTNLVDYAGLYPPAALSLPVALTNYGRYLASTEGWILNRLVLPATKLDDVEIAAPIGKTLKHLSDTQINRITHRNAMRFFNFDPFKRAPAELTVGALRAQAVAKKVDTTPRSSGGAKPLADGEASRRVTSGDLMKMFAHHAQAGK